MKLLLTSEGIRNKTIEDKFFELVGKKPGDITVAYIPTSVTMAPVTDKRWMINSLKKLDQLGIGQIDIVDFSAVPKENWLPRLQAADVIYVEGGHGSYLVEQAEKSGFSDEIKDLLENRVYVGCSAASMFMGEFVVGSSLEGTPPKGLGLVDFSIRPHFLRSDHPMFPEEKVQELAHELDSDFYAIDDDTAIVVVDGKVEVVSEGKWKKFEK